jgi:hypothetical protein
VRERYAVVFAYHLRLREKRRRTSIGSICKRVSMLNLIVILMFAAGAPTAAETQQICDVGRAAFHDLPPASLGGSSDTYFDGPDANRNDLLSMCPALKAMLPIGYRLADSDARQRAAVHVPQEGTATRPASIYTIRLPEISANRQSAVVRFAYRCTGLCGGAFEARYVRTLRGWQRDGLVRTRSVS